MDMHEQEFVPESQSQSHGQDASNEVEINYPAQPYYWSTQKPNAPKEEPASLYDDPMVQSENSSEYKQGYSAPARSRFQQQQYSPDGDSFEQQYQYHANYAPNQQWSVPLWARPQVQRVRGRSSRWFWLVLLGLLCIGPMLHLLGFLLVAGVIFLTLLFPLLIVGLFSIPFMLSRALTGKPSPQRRWRYTRFWRMNNRPWRW